MTRASMDAMTDNLSGRAMFKERGKSFMGIPAVSISVSHPKCPLQYCLVLILSTVGTLFN